MKRRAKRFVAKTKTIIKSENERIMRKRGEDKVWNTIMSKNGNGKSISSTQDGQVILFKESERVLPDVSRWVNEGCSKLVRKEMKEYFYDDDVILVKTLETYFILAGEIYFSNSINKDLDKSNRHKQVNSIRRIVFNNELSLRSVFMFVSMAIHYSEFFFSDRTSSTDEKAGARSRVDYSCRLSEDIIKKVSEKSFNSFYSMPMTEPPKDWSFDGEEITGGYIDHQHPMVRSGEGDIDYNKLGRKIFDSVNYIQSTAWVINEPVLRALERDIKKPIKGDYVKVLFPSSDGVSFEKIEKRDGGNSAEEERVLSRRREYYAQVELYNAEVNDYDSAVGKYRAIMLGISIANEYIGKTIWFPHNYDFRGRVYPITIGLSPQGSDEIKSLLLYKDTLTMNEKGVDWNWAYLASVYGEDKLQFPKRVEFGKSILYEDYRNADEPYQFLSQQLELQKWVEDMDGYQINTRIHLDACNSGSQFTSAMTRDLQGCINTNVVPTYSDDGTQNRQDAYLIVRDNALAVNSERMAVVEMDLARLEHVSEKGSLDEQTKTGEELEELRRMLRFYKFSEALFNDKGRKCCKTIVMVSVYGGSAQGAAAISFGNFREFNVDREWINKKDAYRFADTILESIKNTLIGGKRFEKYIQLMCKVIAKQGTIIEWTTGDGFYVALKKYMTSNKDISCRLPNGRRKTTISYVVFKDTLAVAKMANSISPNVVHSIDAELLRRVAIKMRDFGISNCDMIHDSFGCHPNYVDDMLLFTKQAFMEIMKSDPLRVLDNELRALIDMKDEDAVEQLGQIVYPEVGTLDIDNGGMDSLIDSDWFFS